MPADLLLHRDADPLRLPSRHVSSSASSARRRARRYAPIHTLSRILRDAGQAVLSWRDGLTESERERRRRTDERRQILAARMSNARTRGEWEAAARELDALEGNDEWKRDDASGDYLPEVIEARRRELDEARACGDVRAMLHLVRTSLSRDLGGMGNVDLYRHSYVGTKRLIERYVDSAVRTIEALVEKSACLGAPSSASPAPSSPSPAPSSSDAAAAPLDPRDLLSAVLYARQSFGRSALLLSGGATLGMAHIGVLKALFEADLLPRIISGASAGSIVCAVLCTLTDEEIPGALHRFPYGDLAVFEETGREDRVSDHVRRLLTEGSWSDIKHLTRVMRGHLGDITFQEAYNRTRRICNIPVSSPSVYELPRLLNYVTAPNVILWSAVAASCSVPLVFNAAPLLAKDPATGRHVPWNPTPLAYIDGSVDNDLPMTRLAEMFNVNHFIVSQVNPHVVPFLARDDYLPPDAGGGGSSSSSSSSSRPSPPATHPGGSGRPPPPTADWLRTVTALAKDETLHRLQFLTELGVLPNLCTKLRSVLSQRYSGDITILPAICAQDLPRLLTNPTPEFMLRNCAVGERATWPKLSRIRDRCAIELALDRAVHTLRARVVFSESQVDLRRLATGVAHLGSGGLAYANGGLGGGGAAAAAATAAAGFVRTPGPRGAPREPADPVDLAPYHRRRRGSGSSVQLRARQRTIQQSLAAGGGGDDDGSEGEAYDGNRERAKTPLRRVAKSHSHLATPGSLSSSGGGPGRAAPPPHHPLQQYHPLQHHQQQHHQQQHHQQQQQRRQQHQHHHVRNSASEGVDAGQRLPPPVRPVGARSVSFYAHLRKTTDPAAHHHKKEPAPPESPPYFDVSSLAEDTLPSSSSPPSDGPDEEAGVGAPAASRAGSGGGAAQENRPPPPTTSTKTEGADGEGVDGDGARGGLWD